MPTRLPPLFSGHVVWALRTKLHYTEPCPRGQFGWTIIIPHRMRSVVDPTWAKLSVAALHSHPETKGKGKFGNEMARQMERWKKDDGSRIEWDSRSKRNFSTIIKSKMKGNLAWSMLKTAKTHAHMHLSSLFFLVPLSKHYRHHDTWKAETVFVKEFAKVCNANT